MLKILNSDLIILIDVFLIILIFILIHNFILISIPFRIIAGILGILSGQLSRQIFWTIRLFALSSCPDKSVGQLDKYEKNDT